MPAIRIRVTDSGPSAEDLIGEILDELHEAILVQMGKFAEDGLRYWRGRTPKITGRLRRSEVVTVVAQRANLRYSVNFHLVGAGAFYYHLVAAVPRNSHLRGLLVVQKWADANFDKYLDAAFTAAGF